MAVAMVAQAGRGRLLTSMAPRRTLRAKRQSRRAPPPQARYDLSGPKAQEAFQPSASAASPPPALSSAPLLPPPPMRGVARGGPPPAAMMKPPQGSGGERAVRCELPPIYDARRRHRARLHLRVRAHRRGLSMGRRAARARADARGGAWVFAGGLGRRRRRRRRGGAASMKGAARSG